MATLERFRIALIKRNLCQWRAVACLARHIAEGVIEQALAGMELEAIRQPGEQEEGDQDSADNTHAVPAQTVQGAAGAFSEEKRPE